MATPTTKAELKEYCLRRLGKPVFEINIDDDQMDDPLLAAVAIFLDIVNLFLYLLEAYRQCDG